MKNMCKRCGKQIELNEIHLFKGGEERRLYVEKMFNTKVTQCSNPPPPDFWASIEIDFKN